MNKARYGSLPFEEQITFFRNKLNLPTEAWDDIWGKAHNSAFVVAGAMENDVLNSFRKAVDTAISEGKSIGWFKSEFNNIVESNGWEHTGDKDWRARIIYNTNMRQSYNAGRWQQLQQFDIWEYRHGDSLNPRINHLAWHGLTLSKDDPFWQTHFPSNGWGCKCKVRGKRNATVDKAPDIELVDYLDKKTGELIKVPKGIDPSFDYAPRATEQIKRQKQKLKESSIPYQAPERLVPSAFSTVKSADIHGLNSVLDKLKDSDAKEQIEKFGQFLAKHKTKSLFLKASDATGKGVNAATVDKSIGEYLRKDKQDLKRNYSHNYRYPRSISRVNGYTSLEWNHVVTKVKAGLNFSKTDINDLRDAVKQAIVIKKDAVTPLFSFSNYVRTQTASADHGGSIITWLHEMGHQVHHKAGAPNKPFLGQAAKQGSWITRYSNSNHNEWHAEHFVAWVLNRDELSKYNEAIAVYFDELMEKALND